MLKIEALSKSYTAGTQALDSVSFEVTQPQIVAIIGPSGAGKSTLIRCVNRLVEPSSGSAILNGENITSLNSAGLRKARCRMGMIFQEYNLVERLTVMENVLSGRLGYVSFWQAWRRSYPTEDISNAFRLLERVGLTGFHDKRADALSGGQRQRVGIARALMQKPDLLLVDEPTASLDPKTSRQVMRILVELAHELNTPTLLNIHDVPLAKLFSDRVLGMQDGKLIFDGAPEELTEKTLTYIYGEEDWNPKAKADTNGDENAASTGEAAVV
ncbi:MAG: phosphonate ABC transporter ATP-binding protein [Gammaproteobacteria bacterium]|nr:phosphonate ABC transporter ATP-binding protein [Gammaproteobacteria bacterium]